MKFTIKKKQPKTYYSVVVETWKVSEQQYEYGTLYYARKKFCNLIINERDYRCLNLIEFQKDGDGDWIEIESIDFDSRDGN